MPLTVKQVVTVVEVRLGGMDAPIVTEINVHRAIFPKIVFNQRIKLNTKVHNLVP